MTSCATKMAPQAGAFSERVKTALVVKPTENEIARVAYQLWLDSRCPIGSDQEHWFRAETMLTNALVAKRDDLSRRPSLPRCGTRSESKVVADLTSEQGEGHWEVWEREWGCARWVSDARESGARVSNRAA
jgi:hypothetical protein